MVWQEISLPSDLTVCWWHAGVLGVYFDLVPEGAAVLHAMPSWYFPIRNRKATSSDIRSHFLMAVWQFWQHLPHSARSLIQGWALSIATSLLPCATHYVVWKSHDTLVPAPFSYTLLQCRAPLADKILSDTPHK